MDEVLSRHRKEQKELQGRITQKKKQANKKTRKGVNDECDRLEEELKEKQRGEIAALDGEDVGVSAMEADAGTLTLEDQAAVGNGSTAVPQQNGTVAERASNVAETHINGATSQIKKPNRQKARLARRAAEQEEVVRRAAEEAKSLPDLKQQERERMLEYMKEQGLQEKEIRADGHCLYSAVADQLDQLQMPLIGTQTTADTPAYRTVRSVAADYIQRHSDLFEPFLEEPLPEYLHKIRNTGEWGGQLELSALAKSYGVDINVLQDFGRVEKIQSTGTNDVKVMWLAYYKHGFGLGEHYNSLRKAR